MKSVLKRLVVTILGWQVKRLQHKNKFKTIAVAGSYGKTSTKLAIVQVLQEKYKVQYQEGNYNDITTVPLVFFGQKAPALFNPLAWLKVFIKNEIILSRVYEYDVVVLELGVDGPGQMSEFKKYLKVDYGLITSLAPEHMEAFASMEEVIKEELSMTSFSKEVLVNANLSPGKLPKNTKVSIYKISFDKNNLSTGWSVKLSGAKINPNLNPTSMPQLYTYANTAVVSKKMQLSDDEIKNALVRLKSVPGRMNTLKGLNGSKIIDDTYNASPDATILALQTLYESPGEKRIALLGNMNELGEESEKYHRDVGKYCDSKHLDLVVTLGTQANEFLADEAKKQGCKVIKTKTPYEAAKRIEKELTENTILLAKGSQNGVFAEEAVKLMLENPDDAYLLVRQSSSWLKKKQASFL